ncbi:MAG TPA: hypothetical protein VMF32_05770 [Xanthobacteraceae bacterium]|nr:hypothetical protein [Xanthobacteraceae bacterium]
MDDIAEDRDRPKLARRVRPSPGNQPEAISEHLAQARNHANDSRVGAKDEKVRAENAARAFIRKISKEAENPYQENEANRGLAVNDVGGIGRPRLAVSFLFAKQGPASRVRSIPGRTRRAGAQFDALETLCGIDARSLGVGDALWLNAPALCAA